MDPSWSVSSYLENPSAADKSFTAGAVRVRIAVRQQQEPAGTSQRLEAASESAVEVAGRSHRTLQPQ
jgi:hypothetical protein